MDIITQITNQPAWGSKEILTLPYGDLISNEMKAMKKSSLGSNEIIYTLFGIKAKEVGFTYYSEFIDMMKEEKTMIGKKRAQDILKAFWNNTCDDYHHNPKLHAIVKDTIIRLHTELKDSNSNKQLRLGFMKQFILLTIR